MGDAVKRISSDDKANTLAVCRELEQLFPGLEVVMQDDNAKVNALGSSQGKLWLAAAISCRRMRWGKYNTVFVTEAVEDALRAAEGYAQLFIVRTLVDGQLHSLDIMKDLSRYPLQMLGRGEPRPGEGSNYREPTRCVPIWEFIKIQ